MWNVGDGSNRHPSEQFRAVGCIRIRMNQKMVLSTLKPSMNFIFLGMSRSQTPGIPTFLMGASKGENSVKTLIWVNIGCRMTPLNPKIGIERALEFINTRREGNPAQSHCRAVSPNLREAELHT